jgi:DNA-binding MarR family transcriptional regulator
MKDPRYPVSQETSMLPVVRALHVCHQRLERVMTRFLEEDDLTPSQFDVLATLGDSEGLPFKELGRQALITGGTLTPVLNRMEAKGLLRRCKDERDQRQVILKLTPEGQALYEQVFLPYVDRAQALVDTLSPEEQAELKRLLHKLADTLAGPIS